MFAGSRSASAIRLPGMATGAAHYWRLWNFNGAGGGHAYGPAFTTPFCFGGFPVPAGPPALRVEAVCTGGSIVAAFNWGTSLAADGYFLDLTLDPRFGAFLNTQVAATGHFWGGLLPNTVHYYRVFAYNAGGGFHSYVDSFRTPPC